MGPKEKYFLDHYRKIYSFNNNDEIPENSIVIGYNDDDSSDDEGLGFRGVIEAWFDKAPHHRSILKEIDWDFHVGKIISSNDDRISSEQKDYSSGYYLEDLYGEVIGPFDFAMILELVFRYKVLRRIIR